MLEEARYADHAPVSRPSPAGLVSFKGMCHLLNFSEPHMRRIIRDPHENFPSFMIGKRRFARRDDIDKWLEVKASRAAREDAAA